MKFVLYNKYMYRKLKIILWIKKVYEKSLCFNDRKKNKK